jgi:hypothetical protein
MSDMTDATASAVPSRVLLVGRVVQGFEDDHDDDKLVRLHYVRCCSLDRQS